MSPFFSKFMDLFSGSFLHPPKFPNNGFCAGPPQYSSLLFFSNRLFLLFWTMIFSDVHGPCDKPRWYRILPGQHSDFFSPSPFFSMVLPESCYLYFSPNQPLFSAFYKPLFALLEYSAPDVFWLSFKLRGKFFSWVLEYLAPSTVRQKVQFLFSLWACFTFFLDKP